MFAPVQELRHDKEIVMAAVRQNAAALWHAPEDHRINRIVGGCPDGSSLASGRFHVVSGIGQRPRSHPSGGKVTGVVRKVGTLFSHCWCCMDLHALKFFQLANKITRPTQVFQTWQQF